MKLSRRSRVCLATLPSLRRKENSSTYRRRCFTLAKKFKLTHYPNFLIHTPTVWPFYFRFSSLSLMREIYTPKGVLFATWRMRKSVRKVMREICEVQEGLCGICGVAISEPWDHHHKGKASHLDHNHRTGKVRGLLCPRCHCLLCAAENPQWLKKASAYLMAHDASSSTNLP